MGRKPVEKKRSLDPAIRQQWLETLRPYCQKNGIRRITMDEIASLLGVSKATLYEHFSSKEDIVSALTEIFLANLNLISILRDSGQPFLDRYLNLFFQTIRFTAEISTVVLQELKKYYPQHWQKVLEFHRHVEQESIRFIQQGIQAGVFSRINPVILSLMNSRVIEAILDPDFLMQTGMTFKQAFADFFQVQSLGLFADPKERLKMKTKIDKFFSEMNLYKQL